MPSYKVREISYDGQVYRSKIEAQWAYFFDQIGVPFQYEPEVTVLPNGRHYCCDFFLPDMDIDQDTDVGSREARGVWIEIKNQGTATPLLDECCKAQQLAIQSGRPVYIFFGALGANGPRGNAYRYAAHTGAVSRGHQFGLCPFCRTVGLAADAVLASLPCGCAAARGVGGQFSVRDAPQLVQARKQATGRRFHVLPY